MKNGWAVRAITSGRALVMAVAALIAPGQLIAQSIPEKFVRPPRFRPPVHAQPQQDPRPISPAGQSGTDIRQVSAVQEVDLPPRLNFTSSHSASGADQWRIRSTTAIPQSDPSWHTQNENSPVQDLTAPEASLPGFDMPEEPPVSPSNPDRGHGDDIYGKSVLVRPQQPANRSFSQPVPHQNGLRQNPVQPRRMTESNKRPASYRNPPKSYYQESGLDTQNVGQGRKSCEQFRDELLHAPITDIVLDTSPLRPTFDTGSEDINRSWTDCEGNVLATGTLTGLERGYILIIDEAGATQRVATARLSDGDRAVVTAHWALPTECSLGCYPFEGRNWICNTVLWKASSLCHKPLYFENIQLERYGHTHGPVMQPFYSTAHFFVSLISVPYQTGIHPPNECVYSLGFYRPGDCAPWLREPLPLSLQGTVRQAAFVVGTAAILP